MVVVELGFEPPSRVTIQTIGGSPCLFRVDGVILATNDVPTLDGNLPSSCIAWHPNAALTDVFGLTDNCDGVRARLQEGREVHNRACDETRAPLFRYELSVYKQPKAIWRQDL